MGSPQHGTKFQVYLTTTLTYKAHMNYFMCVCVCVFERERERERERENIWDEYMLLLETSVKVNLEKDNGR